MRGEKGGRDSSSSFLRVTGDLGAGLPLSLYASPLYGEGKGAALFPGHDDLGGDTLCEPAGRIEFGKVFA
jgi:hypothetical protein